MEMIWNIYGLNMDYHLKIVQIVLTMLLASNALRTFFTNVIDTSTALAACSSEKPNCSIRFSTTSWLFLVLTENSTLRTDPCQNIYKVFIICQNDRYNLG